MAKIEMQKRATSPLYNDRKMKLATFCSNLSGDAGMRAFQKDVLPLMKQAGLR